MKKKKCYFFVDDAKTSFVHNEINAIADNFEEVVIVSKERVDINRVNVKSVILDYSDFNSKRNLIKNFFLILGILISDFSFSKVRFSIGYFNLKLSILNRCVFLSEKLSKEIGNEKEALYYTFWFNDWATVLSVLVKKGVVDNYISRAHGNDLYEERIPKTSRIPFRSFQLKQVKNVFCVSKQGSEYLKAKYTMFSSKVQCAYLGTKDFGMGLLEAQDTFTIVSCAHVRNIKRIHRIPEILQYINFPIHWIHIGSEHKTDPTVKLLHENVLKVTKEKSNVKISFLGALSNSEIYEFYKHNYVNLFVSVSETEGLPVSMMEAISFGIPILSSDVGGCKEIVTSETGMLFNKDFENVEVANLIEEEYRIKKYDKKQREAIRKFWESTFDSKKTTDYFLQFV